MNEMLKQSSKPWTSACSDRLLSCKTSVATHSSARTRKAHSTPPHLSFDMGLLNGNTIVVVSTLQQCFGVGAAPRRRKQSTYR